jgi:hypothetical protein
VIGEGSGTSVLNIYSSIVARADANISFLDVLATYDQSEQQMIVNGANNLLRRYNLPVSAAITTLDPLLAPLADNGGPTLTHALLADSPAYGLGSNPLGFATDQRGASSGRTFLGRIDIGALETQSVVGPPPPGDYNRNQTVDAADYVVWRKNVGRTVTQFTNADGDGNTQIDSMDYLVWRSQFGVTAPPSTPTIESITNNSTLEIGRQSAAPENDAIPRSESQRVWYESIFDLPTKLSQTSISTEKAANNISLEARQLALLQILGDQRQIIDQLSNAFPPHSSFDSDTAHDPGCLIGSVSVPISPEWT